MDVAETVPDTSQTGSLWPVLERLPLAVWAINQTSIQAANEPALRLFGAASLDAMTGRLVSEFVNLPVGSGVPCRVHLLDGSAMQLQVTAFSYNLEDPGLRYVIFLDALGRERAEERLRERTERFEELASNSSEVFTIRDAAQQRMLYVSPAYEVVWQRSCQSLYDNPRSWLDAVHADDRARLQHIPQRLDGMREEFRIQRPDGEIRWIRARSFPVIENGVTVRILGIAEDVSDWKTMEGQLAQSQKMDAVGRLAGGIAHDFNNLLTVINGYAALLAERTGLPDDAREEIESIQRAGQRAAGLTSQLLLFSRKQPLQAKSLDLNTSVRQVEPILRRLIREDLELTTVFTNVPLPICVDPTQLEQVVMNLVINARDAIGGTGTITIETGSVNFDAAAALMHNNSAPGRYAMVAVSDTGKGMTAAVQERIFEPFFTTKELGQGTGLGLATVYGIVKQHAGTIWVYSELGSGSTFKVYLPLAEAEMRADEPVASEPERARGPGLILLVEDDEQVRRMTASLLRGRGYTVLEAANGDEALAIGDACRLPIDLVITDVIMPKMGGHELAEKLVSAHPESKVLFMSGYTENAIVQSGRMPAGLHHLDKPFTPEALVRKIGEIFAARSMRA